jgi:hypothetical protein
MRQKVNILYFFRVMIQHYLKIQLFTTLPMWQGDPRFNFFFFFKKKKKKLEK